MIGSLAAGAGRKQPSEGKRYLKRTFSASAVGSAGLGAAATQGTNTPSEWGQGAGDFGKRLGSAFGKHLVKSGIQYPVGKMFHEEFGYQRSNKRGAGPRLKYALESTVITHRTTTGKRTVSKGELAGAFGSGMLSRCGSRPARGPPGWDSLPVESRWAWMRLETWPVSSGPRSGTRMRIRGWKPGSGGRRGSRL